MIISGHILFVNGTPVFCRFFRLFSVKKRRSHPCIGMAPLFSTGGYFLVWLDPQWQLWVLALHQLAIPVPKGGEVGHLTHRIRRNGGSSRPPFSADNKKSRIPLKKDTATAHWLSPWELHPPKREEVSCAPYTGRYSDLGVQTRSPPSQSFRSSDLMGTTSPIQQRLCAGFSPDFPFELVKAPVYHL